MSAASSPFKALGNFRILPRLIGWPALIVGFLARAPYAMLPLGILTAFTAATGSVSIGGLATAAFSLSTAASSPLIGRAADVFGQRALLLTLIPLNSLGIGLLFLISLQDQPGWYLWLACIATGATNVPVGSFTRSRWIAKATAPYQIAASFSYESMADELVFVLGPALVGIAASAAAPSAPLGVAFVLMLAMGVPFALAAPSRSELRPAAEESGGANPDHPPIPRVLWSVLPSILILVAVGSYFGATQTATTVRATDLGHASQAGLAYAVMGIGSAIMSLLVVMVPERIRLTTRVLVFSLGMAISMALVIPQTGLGATAAFLGLAGLWVGPTLVTAFTITERIAPPGGISVALTAMASSVTIGVSLGSGFGGLLATATGAAGAYWYAVGAAVLILVMGAILRSSPLRDRFSSI